MKNFLGLASIAIFSFALIGCYGDTPAPDTDNTPSTESASKTPGTTNVSLTSDLCAKCGDAAGSETCCKGETCESCKMQKGTALCCSGVKPADGVYCKACGFTKGTDQCCAEGNEACSKCGLAKGSPICCKIKSTDGDKGHDEHADHDHDDKGHEKAHDEDAGHDEDK